MDPVKATLARIQKFETRRRLEKFYLLALSGVALLSIPGGVYAMRAGFLSLANRAQNPQRTLVEAPPAAETKTELAAGGDKATPTQIEKGPTPSSTSVSRTTGRLKISLDQAGTLWVDGQEIGTVTRIQLDLPPGHHTIVAAGDRRTLVHTANVKANECLGLYFNLTPPDKTVASPQRRGKQTSTLENQHTPSHLVSSLHNPR